MKIVIAIIMSLSVFSAHADDMAFQGALGMQNGAVHVAADVDIQKKKSHSFGGYFVYGPEKESIGRGSFWSLGGDVKVFFGPTDWKLYLGPGVGLISAESLTTGDSEITLGTVFKVGALYDISYDMALGLEYMHIRNWFSDEMLGTYNLTHLVLRINF